MIARKPRSDFARADAIAGACHLEAGPPRNISDHRQADRRAINGRKKSAQEIPDRLFFRLHYRF
ncbi:MAG: hypothetical protein J0I68_29925 [Achromobacter sp.]|jgi:hypothetical protein|uniref:hypothetical protein n=1 Tax=Achromobacter TaxID=222 RepID=UPI0012E282CE|nr:MULTISPECIES: hypothetical protein [Achromobacter]MBN9642784.1 hypothetical protein [Achromobacter sp.]